MDTSILQPNTGIQQTKVDRNDVAERRRRYIARWTAIKSERGRHLTKWVDLTDHFLPERGRFIVTEHNRPKDTSKILNNTTTRMARVLAAGLMSGCTPRARPWLELTLPDDDMAKWEPAKIWLWEYTQRMRKVLEMSGFYPALSQSVYPDLGQYGLGSVIQEEDPRTVMRWIPLAMGVYGLAQDGQQRVNATYYEEPWSVGELVDEFGWENVSNSVKVAWNNGHYDQFVTVLRVIEPNAQFIPGMIGPRGKRWGSAWMELGGLGSSSGVQSQPALEPTSGFLRESGYEEFPVQVARWAVTSRDVYPTGPGHDALPDAKQLMQLEKRALLALSKGVNPPMLIPDTMRLNRLSMLPGDAVYVPGGTTQKIEPAQSVHHEFLQMAENKIRVTEDRIASAFYADLMRRLVDKPAGAGKQPVTAQEIAETKQEIMLQLGPVLDNVNDFLSRVVDRTHGIMVRRKLMPPPPKELRGMPLVPRFISVLFQAQKMIGVQVKERALAFVGQMAQLKKEDAIDLLDTDKMGEGYFDDLGLPPDCVTPMAQRQQMRQQRQQQQAAAQQAAMAQSLASSAKDASQAQVGEDPGDNVLARLMGPMAAAQGGGR